MNYGPDQLSQRTVDQTDLRRPWRPRVSGIIGALFGPVAAAIVCFVNLRRLGARRKASSVLLLSLIGSVLLGSLMYVLQETSQHVARLVGNFISPFLYPILQLSEFEAWRATNPGVRTDSGWRATGWGLVGGVVFLALALLGAAPWLFTETVRDIDVALAVQSRISPAKEFSFEIQVHNAAEKPQILKSLDFDRGFVKAVHISRTEPPFTKSEAQLGGITTYYLSQLVPPRGKLVVRVYATAPQPGEFKSNLGICIKSDTNCAYFGLTILVVQ